MARDWFTGLIRYGRGMALLVTSLPLIVLTAMWVLSGFSQALGPVVAAAFSTFIVMLSNYLDFLHSTVLVREKDVDIEVEKPRDKACRVLAVIYNNGGVIIKSTKGTLTIKRKDFSILLKKEQLADEKICKIYSVNRHYPKVAGELLPWAVPEGPVNTPYQIITSISPGQGARLYIFEAEKRGSIYIVKVYSEFFLGPPRVCLQLSSGGQRDQSGDDTLYFEVRIAGESLRKPIDICLEVNYDFLEKICSHDGDGKISSGNRGDGKLFKFGKCGP